MNAASVFRQVGKSNGWNTHLYNDLKKARECSNMTYKYMIYFEKAIKYNNNTLYEINKLIHNKRNPTKKASATKDTVTKKLLSKT